MESTFSEYMDYGITVIVYCYILIVFVNFFDFILFDIFSLICCVFYKYICIVFIGF